MPTEILPDEPGYYSDGQYAASAKALTEIIVPALTSVRENLHERDFYNGLFTTKIEEKFVEHIATLTVKPKGQPASSLTFKYDGAKGIFKVKETIKNPQQTTIKGNTTLVVKSANTHKAHHIKETDLTKEILEKVVFDFVDALVQSSQQQSKQAPPAKIVSDKSAPALTSRQSKSLTDAVSAIIKGMDKDPDKPMTLSQVIASGKKPQDIYDMEMLMDKKRIYWQTYLIHAATDGMNKKIRTPAKRRAAVQGLQKELKAVPTTAILKAAYPLIIIDDATCELLDADLKSLSL